MTSIAVACTGATKNQSGPLDPETDRNILRTKLYEKKKLVSCISYLTK